MKPYANRGGDSNVARYELGGDYIIVEFRDGSAYKYTYASAGATNIERMKSLAQNGKGLNSFINRHVRKSYSRKL